MSARYYGIFRPRLNKVKGFNYVPRYYDADMDDLKMRMEATERSMNNEYDPKGMADRIRAGFHRDIQPVKTAHRSTYWVSRIRFVLIATILTISMYYLMTSDILSFIFEAFDDGRN